MASLQDQLLQAGVVDPKKAKKIKQEKRKEARSRPKGKPVVEESKEQARQAMREKAERDRQLNKQQQAVAAQKATRAQIMQLIEMNRIDRQGGEVAFQFVDGKKIKKLYVTTRLQSDLSKGRLAIVRLGEGYEVLPAAAAQKIMQRDEATVVLLNDKVETDVDEDDPYAQYQIPDDLMW